jgi:hypothetical protein
MTQDERDRLIRQYEACKITWYELRERGFEDYIQVLRALGDLGLRPSIARIVGPKVAARQRGVKMLREALERTRFQTHPQKPKRRGAVSPVAGGITGANAPVDGIPANK